MNENDIININTNENYSEVRETTASDIPDTNSVKEAEGATISENHSSDESTIVETKNSETDFVETYISDTSIPLGTEDNDTVYTDPYNKYISPETISQETVDDRIYNPAPVNRYSYYNEQAADRELSRNNLINSIYSSSSSDATDRSAKAKKKAPGFFTVLAMSAVFGLIAAVVFIAVTKFYISKNPELVSRSDETPQVQLTTGETSNTRLNLIPSSDTIVSTTATADPVSASSEGSNSVAGKKPSINDVPDIVEKALPSIVSIECVSRIYNSYYGSYSSSSAGSGIIIRKTDKELDIATNNHVVDGASEISVTFSDGTSASAYVKGKDEDVDVAVISVKLSDLSNETLNAISVATLGDSNSLRMGEMMIVLGNSLGYGPTVTVGYLSAKDRSLTVDGKTYSGLLQTDAAINPGNSGGALVNIKGEVIGINNGKVGGTAVEGVGYAIPIAKVEAILNDFMNREVLTTEEQGFLGVTLQTVSESTSNMYGWPVGAYISSIVEDSAAEKADIRVGDIITGLDETQIKDSESLVEKIKSIRHGTEVTVTVQRLEDGTFVEKKIKVVLGKRPTDSN